MSRWDGSGGVGSGEAFESVRIIKPPKPAQAEAVVADDEVETADHPDEASDLDGPHNELSDVAELTDSDISPPVEPSEPAEPVQKQRSVIYINADGPSGTWDPPQGTSSSFSKAPLPPPVASPAGGDGTAKPRPVIIIDADAPLDADSDFSGSGGSKAEVDPRFRARRRAIKRAEGRRRFRVLVAVFSVFALIIVISLVLQSPLFSVREVRVDGLRFADRAAVQAVADSLYGQPLYRLDQEKAKEEILIQPWVRRVRIIRTWPRSVTIDIAERTPVATAQLDDGLWRIIDIEGHVLSMSDGQPQNYPVLEGDPKSVEVGGVLSAPMIAGVRLADSLPDRLKGITSKVKVGGDGAVALEVSPKGLILLGTIDDLRAKLIGVLTYLDSCPGVKFELLDARAAGALVMTPPNCLKPTLTKKAS